MKNFFIIGNWKSYKTAIETKVWLDQAKQLLSTLSLPAEKKVIVCPPFTQLSQVADFIKANNLPFVVGSQDISAYSEGAFTGGINAKQIKEFAEYTIIGHSERRRFFGETDEMLTKKVEQAIASGLTPIYCVQGKEDSIPKQVTIVGYEPVTAIGSGIPDTPQNAQSVSVYIKTHNPQVRHVIYGGSVVPENVSSFTIEQDIDGVLVGGASLDAKKFFGIANNA